MNAHRRDAHRGYTLLELVIALALGAGLLILLSQAVYTLEEVRGHVAQDVVEAHRMEQARAVLDLLLHSALVPSEDRPEIAALRGEPEVIEFVAAPPRALEATGLVEVRVTIEPEGAGPLRGLFVATRPLTPPHAGLARTA